jgi:hypothetical protein
MIVAGRVKAHHECVLATPPSMLSASWRTWVGSLDGNRRDHRGTGIAYPIGGRSSRCEVFENHRLLMNDFSRPIDLPTALDTGKDSDSIQCTEFSMGNKLSCGDVTLIIAYTIEDDPSVVKYLEMRYVAMNNGGGWEWVGKPIAATLPYCVDKEWSPDVLNKIKEYAPKLP